MGLRVAGRAGVIEAEPNVVPMIDVLLVLLIIYMLSLRGRHAIDVQVPPPERNTAAAQTQIVLELLPGAGYAINGQPVPDSTLDSVIGQIYSGRASKLLFIKAAADRRYREVIEAMDRSRGAGVQVIAIVPKETGRR